MYIKIEKNIYVCIHIQNMCIYTVCMYVCIYIDIFINASVEDNL